MRQIFKDEEHNRCMDEDGYVLVKVFGADVITQMENFYLANSDQNFTGFHHSLELHSFEQKAKICRFLAQVFAEHLSRYFNAYRAITSTFVSKRDGGSTVYPHQDWSFVNEAEFTSLNLWAPLCDTNEENGALGVFRGSHRLKPNIRGSNITPNVMIPDHLLKYLTFIPMKAGEVLIYDHRIIHASGANKSGKQRTAASISIIPSEAMPVHYLGNRLNASTILELEVDEEFYNHCRIEKSKDANPFANYIVKTEGYRSREIEYAEVRIDEQEMARLYEPKGIAFLRQLKDRLKARVSF